MNLNREHRKLHNPSNGPACSGTYTENTACGFPHLETEQDPVGFLGTEAFQTVVNQGREGIQRQGRSSQKTIVQPWGRVLVPPQGIHITISLGSSAELNPQQMEDVNILHSREGHNLVTLRRGEAHQETTQSQIKGM